MNVSKERTKSSVGGKDIALHLTGLCCVIIFTSRGFAFSECSVQFRLCDNLALVLVAIS